MMAKTLTVNGAKKVYILGRRLEVLKKAALEHPSLSPIQCDVTSKEALQSAVDQITAECGYINLLVPNSGVMGPKLRYSPTQSISELRQSLFTDGDMAGMTEVMHVNVTATFFTMTAFLELLDVGNKNALKGGFGKPIKAGSDIPAIQSQVIFISSISAHSRHWLCSPPYFSSKAALTQIAKHASTQLVRFGIRVNAMAPGCKYHILPS